MSLINALQVERLTPDFSGVKLVKRPRPLPGVGEVRVAVHAAAINFPDVLMARGEYQYQPPLPFGLGMEMAGTIDAVGDGVDASRIGEAVIAGARSGCMADAVCIPASTARAKPAALNWEEAASFGAAYVTAWVTLVRRAQVRRGEWVLVHGAAGGVGLACVDVAKHLGARVIAAGISPAKLAEVQRLYAPDAIVDVRAGFRDQVKTITGGGADVIIDPVGGDIFDESTRCIAFDGRLMVVGFAGGRIPSISANIPLIKGFSVMGVRAGEYGRRFPDRGVENLAAIDALAAAGALKPHVHKVIPMDCWHDAFALFSARPAAGKIVLVP